MRRYHCLLIAAFVLATLVVGRAQPAPRAWRPDRIIIQPKAGLAAGAVERLHGRQGARIQRRFASMGDMQVISVPAGMKAEELMAQYQRSGLVEFAEPDYLLHASASPPNDPYYVFGAQWGLNNFGQAGGKAGADIRALDGWNVLNSASNIIVAVIDSGVRTTHEDLVANLWRNPGEIPGDGIDNDSNGFVDDVFGINTVTTNLLVRGDPADDNGHGTHVSGIIGATANNGRGIAGVCWRVQLMSLKFLDEKGNGATSDAVECMNYARAKGAKVINCSFSGEGSTAFYNAVTNARADGIIVVCAAGNDGMNIETDHTFPASFTNDNLVCVAATTRSDELADYSNYGATSVDIGAPGEAIISTWYTADNAYALSSGTSMAAPHVSGMVALLLARFPNEDYSRILRRLYEAADRVPALAGKTATGARANLGRALGNYQMGYTSFVWIATNGMTPLSLGGNGVSAAIPLPFAFNYYGQNRAQLYIAANGLLGFNNSGMTTAANADIANTSLPNGAIYPFWDDLVPSAGRVLYGVTGTAPHRRFAVTWSDVPRAGATQIRLTFQAILEETSHCVVFQYKEVWPDAITTLGGGGRSATVGLENDAGTLSARWEFNGSPVILTNDLALVFTPFLAEGSLAVSPLALNATGFAGGPFYFTNAPYTLTNSGGSSVAWSVSVAEPWLDVAPPDGVLAPGEGTNVLVTLDHGAITLGAGAHTNTLAFRNISNGAGDTTRAFVLQLRPRPLLSLAGGTNDASWQLRAVAEPGQAYVIEVSANLQEWLPLSTNIADQGGVFNTSAAGGAATRFYRCRLQ